MKELTGRELYNYYTCISPDKEYASVVKLLPLAIGDLNEAFILLEKIEKTGKKLFAVYPAIPELAEVTEDMEFIGPIEDGGLYIK